MFDDVVEEKTEAKFGLFCSDLKVFSDVSSSEPKNALKSSPSSSAGAYRRFDDLPNFEREEDSLIFRLFEKPPIQKIY